MPDDAIERARRIGIQVAAELPDGTPPPLYIAVAGGASRGAMIAFASQQAPEGWRPIETATHPQQATLPALLDRLQSLSLPGSSLQKAQTSDGDIDRSGLAQEVDDISYAGVGP